MVNVCSEAEADKTGICLLVPGMPHGIIMSRILQFLHTELLGFWTFSIVRYSGKQKKGRFGNWICFRLQVKGKTPSWVP
jgi:hypothetical protein